MKLVDPAIELVACGRSHSAMPTFGAWEATVLERAYDLVDYVSLHAYYARSDGDLGSFLASAARLDAMIIDAWSRSPTRVAAARRLGRKRIDLSFDEWNVWYRGSSAAIAADDWPEAPRAHRGHLHRGRRGRRRDACSSRCCATPTG